MRLATKMAAGHSKRQMRQNRRRFQIMRMFVARASTGILTHCCTSGLYFWHRHRLRLNLEVL